MLREPALVFHAGFLLRRILPQSALRETTLNSNSFELEPQGTALMAFGEPQTTQTDLDPTQHDIVLQLDTIGDTVTASAWYANEPKPDSPPFASFYQGRGALSRVFLA